MKQVFFGFVMICSLLLAICGCSNGLPSQQAPDLESQEESDIDQEKEVDNKPDSPDGQKPDESDQQEIDQGETGNNDPDPTDEQEPDKPVLTKAEIEINELRTEYLGSSSHAEFVEFKVKSAGDLGGLRLCIMWDSKKPYYYDFPTVDVKLGEYITLHLRTLESTCVDELGEDLSESGGTDSCPTARDLWVSGNDKLLHKTDIVYLKDADGRILDAVILNEKPGETWEKNREHLAEIMEDLYNKGAWKSADGQLPSPLDAVDTSTVKTAVTRSISRYEDKENTHSAQDWYVTDSGKASPGQPNK